MWKPAFIKKLSENWYKGMSEKNIVASFESTRIYPIYVNKYLQKWFDWRLLRGHNKWVAAGKPEDF